MNSSKASLIVGINECLMWLETINNRLICSHTRDRDLVDIDIKSAQTTIVRIKELLSQLDAISQKTIDLNIKE